MDDPSRSPIKDKPLRNPGQSLEEERQKLFEDKIEPYALVALVFILFAGMEWYRYFTNLRPNPILFSMVAVLGILIAVRQFRAARPRMRALRQGAEGEKVVGQYLERLRAEGYSVFHDVKAATFNLDHVLIGPSGVYTVETKTWSKPARGDARVVVDGDRLTVGRFEPERAPLVQASGQASWLRQLLFESTGKTFTVKPVILFPGWYVEQSKDSLQRMWVLEPKALPAFLQNAPSVLGAEDAKLAAFHLSRYIRGVERERGV